MGYLTTIRACTIVGCLAFSLLSSVAASEGSLVLALTTQLDQSVDREFEIITARWVGKDTLGLLTADGSVLLVRSGHVVKTLRSNRAAFNANAFAVSTDLTSVAVGTSTGLFGYDAIAKAEIRSSLRMPLLALGYRGSSSLIAVGQHGVSTLTRVGNEFVLATRFKTPDVYWASVSEDGSLLATIDRRAVLKLFQLTDVGSVSIACSVPMEGYSHEIQVGSFGAIVALNQGSSGRIVSVDRTCHSRDLYSSTSGRILGISASQSRFLVRTEGAIEVWSIEHPHKISGLSASPGIGAFAVSPDGRTIAIIRDGSTFQIWNIIEASR